METGSNFSSQEFEYPRNLEATFHHRNRNTIETWKQIFVTGIAKKNVDTDRQHLQHNPRAPGPNGNKLSLHYEDC